MTLKNQPYNKEYYTTVLFPKNRIYSQLDRNKIYIIPIKKIVPKGDKVLDVATGLSDIPERLLKAGYNVHACDNSEAFLKIKKLKNITYKKVDMFKLSYEKDTFGAIILKDIIEHYEREKIGDLLHSFDKMLKPNGVLVIGVPVKTVATRIAKRLRKLKNREYSAIDDTTDTTHKHWYTEEDLNNLMKISLPKYKSVEKIYLMYGINNFPKWLIRPLHFLQKILHRSNNLQVSQIIQKYFGFRIMVAFQKQ